MSKWDKQSIHELLDRSPKAVARAVVAVYRYQTETEKVAHQTTVTNGVGFSKYDAEFLTSIAEQVQSGRVLSAKQINVTRNKIKRYWRQLVSIANNNAAEHVDQAALEKKALEAEAQKAADPRNGQFA